jgi:hypothetical protein
MINNIIIIVINKEQNKLLPNKLLSNGDEKANCEVFFIVDNKSIGIIGCVNIIYKRQKKIILNLFFYRKALTSSYNSFLRKSNIQLLAYFVLFG